MGFKLPRETPPMERELNYLLYDLCVIWGFCIPPESNEHICKMTNLTAEAFAVNVIEAEGLDSKNYRKYVRRIEAKFRERFGQDDISIETFIDRERGHKEDWSL